MEVLSILKHHIVSDGANPIAQHFRFVRLVASAGQQHVWKIYDAVRIKDGKEASVFLFEKRVADKLHKPKRREIVTDLLRRDVITLSRMRHPRLVRVLHTLEECNDSLAFATEPITASLSNLLGNNERLTIPLQQELKDHSFLDAEIKYGLLQIAEGLNYLHNVEHLVHLNVSPQCIVVTRRGMWKLLGLGFAQSWSDSGPQDTYPVHSWSAKMSKMAQPDLDYMAPEIQLETSKYPVPACDVFSFGLLVSSVYNGGRSLIQAAYNPVNYAKELERKDDVFSEVVQSMPVQLVEPVERMINKDARYRPSMHYFMALKYFEDPVVRCMQVMDCIDSKEFAQKCEFFAILPQAIPQFPKKLLHNSVMAMLREQLESPDMMPFVLPSLVAMIEHSSNEDYRKLVQPEFRKVINGARPVQATVYLLEKLDVLLAKATEDEIKSEILPMVFSSLESNSIQAQEAAINVFSNIKHYLDDQTLRKLVLPKAKAIFNKSTAVRTRTNALECLDRLIDSLDKMMILEELLPFLTEIQCSDVDIIMSVVSIYRHLLSDRKFGLTHNLLATKVLPTLIPLSVSPGLTIDQFGSLMEVLHTMLDQVEQQRLNKMVTEMPDCALGQRSKTTGSTGPDSLEAGGKAANLNINDKYFNKIRPTSNQDTVTNGSNDNLLSMNKSNYRRHSSFQGLGMVEQAALQDSLAATGRQQGSATGGNSQYQRRGSIMPGSSLLAAPGATGSGTPHIMVSEASVSDFKESFGINGSRRSSSASVGPVIIPDAGRRNSGSSRLTFDGGFNTHRRSSFQGMCDSAMQLFSGKLS